MRRHALQLLGVLLVSAVIGSPEAWGWWSFWTAGSSTHYRLADAALDPATPLHDLAPRRGDLAAWTSDPGDDANAHGRKYNEAFGVDAAQYDGEPGTTKVFVGEQMDAFIGGNRKCSVHEVSLIDLMAIALLSGQLPQQRALIGIQPQTIAWGETPTPPVASAIQLACDQALQLVEEWHA